MSELYRFQNARSNDKNYIILYFNFKFEAHNLRLKGCRLYFKEFIADGPNCALSLKSQIYSISTSHFYFICQHNLDIFYDRPWGYKKFSCRRKKIPFHVRKIYVESNWMLHTRAMVRNKGKGAKRLVQWHEVMNACTVPTLQTDWTSNFWAQRTTLSLRLTGSGHCRYSEHNLRCKIAAGQHYSMMMLQSGKWPSC